MGYKKVETGCYKTFGDEINDNIDNIRVNAYAMILDRYHGRSTVFDDSDDQCLADIEQATVKIIQAVKRWEQKNCCCCAPEAKYGDVKTYPPYLDHEK